MPPDDKNLWQKLNNYVSEILGMEVKGSTKVDKKEIEKRYSDLKELESLKEKVNLLEENLSGRDNEIKKITEERN